MKIRNVAYTALRCGCCRRIHDRFGRAQRSSQEEESAAAAAGTAAGGMLGDRPGSGLRDQGRPEVHLHQLLLRGEGWCHVRESGRVQSGEGRRAAAKRRKPPRRSKLPRKQQLTNQTGRCDTAARFQFTRGRRFISCAAEFAISSAICSLVSGFSRNFNSTASRWRHRDQPSCRFAALPSAGIGHRFLEHIDRPVDLLRVHFDRLRIGIHPVH